MDHREPTVKGLDTVAWKRLWQAFSGASGADKGDALLVVRTDAAGTAIGAFRSGGDAVPLDAVGPLDDLAELANRHQVSACAVVPEFEWPIGVPPGGVDFDLRAEVLLALKALLHIPGPRDSQMPAPAHSAATSSEPPPRRSSRPPGATIRWWPNPIQRFGWLSLFAPNVSANLVLPDQHAAVLCLFDADELWTALVARRDGARIDFVGGPDAIRDWTGELGGDWRRDHRVISQAVARECAPLSVGLYTTRTTASQLFTMGDVGTWSLAATTREVIFAPWPKGITQLVDAEHLRGYAALAAQLFEGIEPDEMRDIARRFWHGLTDGQGVKGLLGFLPTDAIGFNPLEVISEVLDEKRDEIRETLRPSRPPPSDESDD